MKSKRCFKFFGVVVSGVALVSGAIFGFFNVTIVDDSLFGDDGVDIFVFPLLIFDVDASRIVLLAFILSDETHDVGRDVVFVFDLAARKNILMRETTLSFSRTPKTRKMARLWKHKMPLSLVTFGKVIRNFKCMSH